MRGAHRHPGEPPRSAISYIMKNTGQPTQTYRIRRVRELCRRRYDVYTVVFRLSTRDVTQQRHLARIDEISSDNDGDVGRVERDVRTAGTTGRLHTTRRRHRIRKCCADFQPVHSSGESQISVAGYEGFDIVEVIP